MANLVPVFIDKTTGDYVASSKHGGGGSGNNNNDGFEFIQSSPLSIWTIPHNKNNQRLLAQVYTLNNEFILPDNIKILNNNTVQVKFNIAMAGIIKIAFF